jgi:type II secretory pathway component PulF
MRLQYASPKDEPSVKKNAVFYPILLLIVIPFALASVLTTLFPNFQWYQLPQLNATNTAEQSNALLAAFFISWGSAFSFYFAYTYRYGILSARESSHKKRRLERRLERKFLERKNSRIQINLYDVLNRIHVHKLLR